MHNAFVKQECPTCRSYGLIRVPHTGPDLALICPHCEGKGWVALNYKVFQERPRLPGVRTVRTTTGQARFLGAHRQPTELTLEQFEAQIPAD